MSYHVNENGYYGEFGGAYIPEMLYPNVEELKQRYLEIMAAPEFQEEFNQLLKDYVGRPSPLYYATRLSEKYQTNIYLKREDLNHTGAHKVNNTIGQILMAKRLGKKQVSSPKQGLVSMESRPQQYVHLWVWSVSFIWVPLIFHAKLPMLLE